MLFNICRLIVKVRRQTEIKNEAAMQPHKNIEIDSFNAPATKPPIPPVPEEEERTGFNVPETHT